MELSRISLALVDGAVDFVAGDASSAVIDRLDLVVLADTRRYFTLADMPALFPCRDAGPIAANPPA